MVKIKLFEMFSGYGGASFGLKKANIPFECVGYSEIDKYAIQCYEKNHCYGKIGDIGIFPMNFGDCKEIDTNRLPDFNLLTGGFPCQDVSIAGKRDLTKGRTNLYQEILRIANDKKPRYMLLENVKGLLSMEIEEEKLLNIIVRDLKKIGYGVCYKVLNSKDYGIPQNRERIWFACKYGSWNFMEFQFPEKEELKIFVKDILEKEVDKKYYLSEKMIKKFIERSKQDVPQPNLLEENDKRTFACDTSKSGGRYQDNFIISLTDFNMKGERVISENNKIFSSLITSRNHFLRVNKNHIIIDPKTHLTYENVTPTLRSGIGSGNKLQVFENLSINPTITTELSHSTGRQWDVERYLKLTNNVRRLTPKECFRLMGFLDDSINLDGLSDTQCYKLAGNGWDVNLVSKIFKRMFK